MNEQAAIALINRLASDPAFCKSMRAAVEEANGGHAFMSTTAAGTPLAVSWPALLQLLPLLISLFTSGGFSLAMLPTILDALGKIFGGQSQA